MIEVFRHTAVATPDIHWRCLVAFQVGLDAATPSPDDDMNSGGGGSTSQIAAAMHESKMVLLSEAARLLATLSGASAASATLAMVYQWARGNVDASLVRHFVVAAAHVITAPFSLAFLQQFLSLVETGALDKFLIQLAKEHRDALNRVGTDALAALKDALDENGAPRSDEKADPAELQRLQELAAILIVDDDVDTASE